MPIPTVQELYDIKTDADDLESLVNGSSTVDTRLGGAKDSYTQLVARISHGDITTYSAAATYTAFTDWVIESGIVYRPIPSSLPIGPEAFDSSKWIAVQLNIEDADKDYAATFLTVEDAINGDKLSGKSISDWSSLATANANVRVVYNNSTSKKGYAVYTVKTAAQAATDGDIIDGSGSPNYYGKNHAITGTSYVLIFLGEDLNTSSLGSSSDAVIEAAIQNVEHSNPIRVSGSPAYTKDIQWDGRPHETLNLPYKINSFTKTDANLGARMWVDGNVLYECVYVANKVTAYSLADPREPAYIASYDVGTNPRHVTVSGRYMFVISNGEDKLKIYEIDSILSAGLIGEITVGEEPKMCIVDGDVVHVICGVTSTIEKYRYKIVNGVADIELVATASVVTTPLAVAHNKEAGVLAVVGLSGGTITLIGERNYNVISNTDIGGGAKSTCEFISKSQLLVASPGDDRVYSVNIDDLSPTVTGFTATVADPEQLIVVGSRAYVPSLTSPPTLSTLSCIDITDGNAPSEYRQIPLSVSGGGFGAYYDDGETGYIYINGHFSPYNIDVIEVLRGKPIDPRANIFRRLGSEYASIGTVRAGQFIGELTSIYHNYSTKTANYTLTADDSVIRAGAGATLTMTLPDPASMLGKQFIIKNVHGSSDVIVSNAFTGFSGTLSAGASVTMIAMDFGGGSQWDAVASYGTIT